MLIENLPAHINHIEEKERVVFSMKANEQFISLNDSLMYFLPQLLKEEVPSPINTPLGTIWDEKAIVILDKEYDKFLDYRHLFI